MMDKPKKILFVCTGNTCRSSMAQSLAQKKLQMMNMGSEQVEIISAGTAAIDGCPASREAIKVLKDRGIDLSGHTAQKLTLNMIKEADYIFTMTGLHKEQVLFIDPSAKGKVFTLKEFSGTEKAGMENHMDILDPFGGSEEIYLQCANKLDEAITKMLKKIIN
jgi:protein-tyrosine-phosphatase